MKKTRFEKFMTSTTKTALALVELDTFEDHLEYTKLMIDMELLKIGKKSGSQKIIKKAGAGKVARISGALGTIKSGLITTGSHLKKIYKFLITGNNFVLFFFGALCLYAVIMMAWEMI